MQSSRSNTGNAYGGDKYYRGNFWTRLLKENGIRYRGPNNCRHTYASQMITSGLPLAWILSQTGHTSEAILRKRYAKYINEDAPVDMAKMANAKLFPDF